MVHSCVAAHSILASAQDALFPPRWLITANFRVMNSHHVTLRGTIFNPIIRPKDYDFMLRTIIRPSKVTSLPSGLFQSTIRPIHPRQSLREELYKLARMHPPGKEFRSHSFKRQFHRPQLAGITNAFHLISQTT